jgi:hypothetical protein
MKVYKIRDNETGLYSTGGYYFKFHKVGKTWTTLGHVKQHISMISDYYFGSDMGEWEIVEYDLTEVRHWPVAEFAKEVDG